VSTSKELRAEQKKRKDTKGSATAEEMRRLGK